MILLDRVPSPFSRAARRDAALRERTAELLAAALHTEAVRRAHTADVLVPAPRRSPEN